MSTRSASPSPLVAVVDDHDSFRQSICSLLKRNGFETCDFPSVPAFLESRALSKIACLILDVSMPGIDGVKFKKALQHTNYDFPVIFCTGLDPEDVGVMEGAAAILRKPVDNQALIDAVRTACSVERR